MDRSQLPLIAFTLGMILLLPLFALADARFVESPAECHFPYDNADTDNEFKLSACSGVLKARNGLADAQIYIEQDNLAGDMFVIDGQDVRDVEAFPSGELLITTTGVDSGADCNIVDAGGTAYATGNWTARTRIKRTQVRWRVNVSYDLTCWGAAPVAQ